MSYLAYTRMPRAEGLVPEPHGLLDGWHFVNPRNHFVNHGNELGGSLHNQLAAVMSMCRRCRPLTQRTRTSDMSTSSVIFVLRAARLRSSTKPAMSLYVCRARSHNSAHCGGNKRHDNHARTCDF